MKGYLIFFIGLIVLNCSPSKPDNKMDSETHITTTQIDRKKELIYQQNLWLNPDTIPVEYGTPPMSWFDSLLQTEIDTSTLEGKRIQIMQEFALFNSPSAPDYDTLFDLNYDGYLDYVIGYYGQSGTGLKNRISVHLFNPKNNNYLKDSLLSSIANPSFYLEEKMLTGFYFGNGGGSGEQLNWIDKKWTITKTISACSVDYPDSATWNIHYPVSGLNEVILDLYRGIPLNAVLKNKYANN